jgi:hypothetical protein
LKRRRFAKEETRSCTFKPLSSIRPRVGVGVMLSASSNASLEINRFRAARNDIIGNGRTSQGLDFLPSPPCSHTLSLLPRSRLALMCAQLHTFSLPPPPPTPLPHYVYVLEHRRAQPNVSIVRRRANEILGALLPRVAQSWRIARSLSLSLFLHICSRAAHCAKSRERLFKFKRRRSVSVCYIASALCCPRVLSVCNCVRVLPVPVAALHSPLATRVCFMT